MDGIKASAQKEALQEKSDNQVANHSSAGRKTGPEPQCKQQKDQTGKCATQE
nr:hypothetical protein [Leclercia sp. 29361]